MLDEKKNGTLIDNALKELKLAGHMELPRDIRERIARECPTTRPLTKSLIAMAFSEVYSYRVSFEKKMLILKTGKAIMEEKKIAQDNEVKSFLAGR